jgi:hypothetical protein
MPIYLNTGRDMPLYAGLADAHIFRPDPTLVNQHKIQPPFLSLSSLSTLPGVISPTATSKAPEAEENQDGDDAEESQEETSSTTSPPPALSKDLGIDKKRKCVEELASLSTSAQRTAAGEAPALEEELELFDLLDS